MGIRFVERIRFLVKKQEKKGEKKSFAASTYNNTNICRAEHACECIIIARVWHFRVKDAQSQGREK